MGLAAATRFVSSRLQMLLDNANIPPKLPAILFGMSNFIHLLFVLRTIDVDTEW